MYAEANSTSEMTMNRQPLYGSMLLTLFMLLRQELQQSRATAVNRDGSPSHRL